MHRVALVLCLLSVACYDATAPEDPLSPGVYEFVETPPFAGTLTISAAVEGEPLGVTFDASNLQATPSSSVWNVSAWRVEAPTTFEGSPSLILRIRTTSVRGDFCQSALFMGEGIACTIRRR